MAIGKVVTLTRLFLKKIGGGVNSRLLTKPLEWNHYPTPSFSERHPNFV